MATAEREKRAWVRPVRLWCGLILLAYITTHFANHAIGLVSLAATEKVRIWFLALWRNPVAETALFGALLVHWLLGLWLIYRRRTVRMPPWEMMQIAFGLAVPPLLAYHLSATRIANALYGTNDIYERVLFNIWVQDPWAGARQAALFCVDAPFRLGVGIHVGPVVVGEMGYVETRYLTAVGDSVNTAARLEQATKEFDCELVVSERVFERAGLDASAYPHAELALRNREATIGVRLVADVAPLARAVAGLGAAS